jgi:type II secretory pathway component GspD/PulD (secretin)
MQIVEELDSSPPQVMIQVLLAEVTVDSESTWGGSEIGPFGGDAYRIGTLGAANGVQTALGVPNLSVSSADFSLLVRALEAQGKLEVLSEPKVMVNNNTEAKHPGRRRHRHPDQRRAFTPQGQHAFERDAPRRRHHPERDTPSINADGFVRMEISPEISTLSTRTTSAFSEGVLLRPSSPNARSRPTLSRSRTARAS